MKKYLILFAISFECLFVSLDIHSQAFKNEIDAFERSDLISMPPPGGIVFVGSSSFRIWKSVHDAFPGYPIINRGFGGSTLPDLINYVQETVIKYDPKQIFIYCGENDIAVSSMISSDTVLVRFKKFYALIRQHLGIKPQVIFVSIKPSISRWHLENSFLETNALIKKFLSTEPNSMFLDVHSSMLNPDGSVMNDLFLADNLHMNSKGYNIWKSIIQPVLMK